MDEGHEEGNDEDVLSIHVLAESVSRAVFSGETRRYDRVIQRNTYKLWTQQDYVC